MRNVFLPASLTELWDTLESHPHSMVYSGGTDLFVKIRNGIIRSENLVCLEKIPELKGVHEEGEYLRIGACTALDEMVRTESISRRFSVLGQSIRSLGSPAIRAQGTIGGNICTASPAGDTLPPLLILEAELELCSARSSRVIPLKDFIIGPGQTQLASQEILISIRIRNSRPFPIQHFEKVGKRNALACALASMAAMVRFASNGCVEAISLAWGSVGPTVIQCPEVEDILIGDKLTPKTLRKAAERVRNAIAPIDDVRSSAGYRRQVAGNLLYRLLVLTQS